MSPHFEENSRPGKYCIIVTLFGFGEFVITVFTRIFTSFVQFYQTRILKYQDDPLFLILLIQFYVKLVRLKAPVDLSLPLSDILSLYDKFDLLVKNEVVELVAQLSFTQSYTDILFKSQIFKTHNLLEVFEKTENSDIRLLSKANPQVIYELNNSIYPDVLAHLNLFTNNLYFPILLNFMSSTTIFYQLKLHLNNENYHNYQWINCLNYYWKCRLIIIVKNIYLIICLLLCLRIY